MKNISVYALAISATLILGCVPQRQFQDIADKQKECEAENKSLKAKSEKLETDYKEFMSRYNLLERRADALVSDTAVMGSSLRIMRNQYAQINALNDQLLNKTSSLREGSEADKLKLMGELEELRLSLIAKEDALNNLEKALDEKEVELAAREEKLRELRTRINEKDSAMMVLRKSVSDALLGFEGKGLTVEYRNGKVYVSMDAKLLFATGSTEVDPNGRKAIIDLARAIQGRDDLRIMVEGHTDTDVFNSTSFPRNNWDLSVLRATSVVSIMIENSDIDPKILTAAGLSQFHPIDPANKARNRRIEVILTPQLDDLLQMIDRAE
jgi:chemotaxis protein MotB